MLLETSSHSHAPSSATATGHSLHSSATLRAAQLLLEAVYKAKLRTLQLLLETLYTVTLRALQLLLETVYTVTLRALQLLLETVYTVTLRALQLLLETAYTVTLRAYNCYWKLFIQTSPTAVIGNSLHNLATSPTAVIGNSLHSFATSPVETLYTVSLRALQLLLETPYATSNTEFLLEALYTATPRTLQI